MAGWKGNGMPGLMHVPRKPTPTGREGHTTACTETGILIHYECYEGKDLMEKKEFNDIAGKNAAKAMRCTKPWFRSGRTVITDSGFTSMPLVKELFDHGLFVVGNVKTAHKEFPKEWLLSIAKKRGDRAVCSTTIKTRAGRDINLLAAADMDKQPMALLASAGTSTDGKTITRKFTTIRSDGTYSVRSGDLPQMHVHEIYRSGFNTLDKHNSYRQGATSFEDTWKTHSWWTREFQMLFEMSVVNAWLAYKRWVPDAKGVSLSKFRRKLCYEMLNNPFHGDVDDSGTRARRGASAHASHVLMRMDKTKGGHRVKRTCMYCRHKTQWYCGCVASNATGKHTFNICGSGKRNRDPSDCFAKHIRGEDVPNFRSKAAIKRWKRSGEHPIAEGA
jgi:hypothetical protein